MILENKDAPATEVSFKSKNEIKPKTSLTSLINICVCAIDVSDEDVMKDIDGVIFLEEANETKAKNEIDIN